jgi:hypothetical protein
MAKKIETPEQTEALETVKKSVQVKFNKTKILGMKRYANRVDLLRVLLKPEETYTLDAVDAAISDFMKGKVN